MLKSAPSDPRFVSFSVFSYCLLLGLLPARFRHVYGSHMAQVFRDCCLHVYRRSGPSGMFSFWFSNLFDLFKVMIEERLLQDTDMNTPKLIRLTGWSMVMAAVGLLLTFVSETDLQADLYSVFGAPATVTALTRVQTITSAAVRSTFFFVILLSALGLMGLRARYGSMAGRAGKAALELGILGGAAALVAGFGRVVGLESAREPMNVGMAIMFGGLFCFGLAAMWTKPMPRGNSLPILAGIWWPLLVIDAYVLPLGIGQLGPVVPWWFTVSIFLLMSVSLAGLGVVLQADAGDNQLGTLGA